MDVKAQRLNGGKVGVLGAEQIHSTISEIGATFTPKSATKLRLY